MYLALLFLTQVPTVIRFVCDKALIINIIVTN